MGRTSRQRGGEEKERTGGRTSPALKRREKVRSLAGPVKARAKGSPTGPLPPNRRPPIACPLSACETFEFLFTALTHARPILAAAAAAAATSPADPLQPTTIQTPQFVRNPWIASYTASSATMGVLRRTVPAIHGYNTQGLVPPPPITAGHDSLLM